MIFVLISSVAVFGQEREITAKEFWGAQRMPIEKLLSRAYRMVLRTEHFHEGDGSKYASSTATADTIYAIKSHTVFKSETENGTKISESIWVNSWLYERDNGGDWKRVRSRMPKLRSRGSVQGKVSVAVQLPDPKHKTTYKFIGRSVVDGKWLNNYEMTTLNQWGQGQNSSTSTYVYNCWIDDNGFPVKSVTESKNANSVVTMRGTLYYDYETVISIDEPTLPGKHKLKIVKKRGAQ